MSSTNKTLLLSTPVLVICGWFAYNYFVTNLRFIPSSDAERAAIRADVAAHDENVFRNKPVSQGS